MSCSISDWGITKCPAPRDYCVKDLESLRIVLNIWAEGKLQTATMEKKWKWPFKTNLTSFSSQLVGFHFQGTLVSVSTECTIDLLQTQDGTTSISFSLKGSLPDNFSIFYFFTQSCVHIDQLQASHSNDRTYLYQAYTMILHACTRPTQWLYIRMY